MERVFSSEVRPGKNVMVKGWVDNVRLLKNIVFVTVRDREGFLQITVKKDDVPASVFETASNLSREDCIQVKGNAVHSKIAKSGIEIIPEDIVVVSKAEKPLPIEFKGNVETGKDTRFDYRYIDVRNPQVTKIFMIRHKIIGLIHEYFRKNGFVEIHTPVIQAAGAEGGATLFEVKYYHKKAFLRQSPQFYKQMMMASGLDRVYEIGQAFRAEKFHTRRHISEFLSLDFEIAWIESEEDVMRVLERMVVYVLKGLNAQTDLNLKVPTLPLKRVTYDEALKILKGLDIDVKWGEDFGDPEEAKLGELLSKKGHDWYFITKYPSKIRPFYIMQDGEVSRGIDLDYKGLELASGGQREHRHDILMNVMKQKGLDPKNFVFYLNAFRWGMPPHGGIGFGVERLVKQILDLPDVQETILFPRTPERLVP